MCAERLIFPTLLLACLAFVSPVADAADPVTVNVTVNSSRDGTRLILTHSRPLVYVVEASRGRVRVRYADTIELRPLERRFNDPILERYRVRSGRTLILDTGPEYGGYETFELRNPFRLIIDLKAQRLVDDFQVTPKRGRLPETIIVIDPGHGGVEHGAVGPTGLMEKEVTLALARRLKRSLQRSSRSISVVLTRDEDRLVGLDERTAIANHNRADLFLSIHLNASPRANATGAETYYLSTDATDDEARTLAALENRSRDSKAKPDERVASGSLDLVLWDLAQNQYIAESSALAESVQRQLNRLTGTRDRGVRQAPFRVLMGAMMPAILVEVGFISNSAEEQVFREPRHQDRVVEAISAAVQEFLLDLARFSNRAPVDAPPDRP